jgi:PAS domain S-box-containing protein
MLQIKSNVTIPLATGDGSTLGAISFGTIGRHRAWREDVLERLEIVAQIFANALARKRAELDLRETESRLDLAADAAAAGLWRLDLATRCFWLTDRTRDLFEFDPDEVVTLDRFLDRVHPDDRNAVHRKVTELVESMAVGQVEYRVHFYDGRIKWMRSQGCVHASAPNQPDSLMGVTLDITANKSAEEALRNFSARLISSQEAERARLARELHDDITQRLACLAIDVGQSELGGADRSLEETRGSVREELIRLGEDVHALSCMTSAFPPPCGWRRSASSARAWVRSA